MTASRLASLALALVTGSLAHAQLGSALPAPGAAKAAATKQLPAKAAPVKLPSGGHAPQPSPQNGVALLVGGGDDCATPDVIAGAGPFSVDTTAATTGAQGQSEPSCLSFGTMAITRDVWFRWTAASSGTTTLSLCAGTPGIDSKVAVYAGAGCPAPSSAIACNNDFCSLASRVSWSATAGQTYMLQIGAFTGAPGYASSFTIAPPGGGPVNDDCSGASPISGVGTFAIDTTGAAGTLTNGVCVRPNSDVWFAWTATSSGTTLLDTCGLVGTDTVIAVWTSGTCPPTALVACNDDFCGVQSRAQFNAVAGTTYLFEIGAFALGGTFVGSFSVAAPTLPPADDDCATATVLAGPGPHPFDSTAATTSAQGQSEPACLFFGSAAFDHDEWFVWTAPASGSFRVETCGMTSVDTRIAVYTGAGCPAAVALVCNDDSCGGLQSAATWSATGGANYTLHLGTFPGATGGVGSFTITPFVPPPNDECSAPSSLPPTGPYAYDNSMATTSTVGQNCSGPLGSPTIDNDLWFCWTAPSSGSFDLTTIGLTFMDTKLAVYGGCGCPAGPSLVCNDDACGTLQSTATFAATAGSTFTIQIGSFPGAPGGPGAFDIAPTPTSTLLCQVDDGTAENSIGLTNGGQFLWLLPFGDPGAQTLVTTISAMYGTPLFPGGGPPVGTPVDVCLYDDPNDDRDPSDAVLISRTPATVGSSSAGLFDTYAVPPFVTNGVFFVGVAINHSAGQLPAALDGNYCGSTKAWAVGAGAGMLDFNVLTNNPVPPTDISAIFGGVWVLRGGCQGPPGVSFCGNGDPNRMPCPCANNGTDPQAGCASSLNPAGARLTTSGFVANNVQLHSTGMSGTLCVFFRTLGPSVPTGTMLGDGITCTGGSLLRLRTVSFPVGLGSIASFPPPPPTTITLAGRSGTFPGSGAVMQYGTYYRSAAAAFCPPATFNTTNTIEITW